MQPRVMKKDLKFHSLAMCLSGLLLASAPAAAQIPRGTVMVSTGNGRVTEYTQDGTLIGQLDTLTAASEVTGSAFDAAGNFFVTTFSAQQVVKFDPAGARVGPFGSGYNADPESITFDGVGNAYVGQADGTRAILKFSAAGALIGEFHTGTENRGTDWIDLASDQCTMFYTSEGAKIGRFDVCTSTQLDDFQDQPLPGSAAYALRIRANGEVLVADSELVVRLDAAGNQIQNYTLPNSNALLALILDPDTTSFWTADRLTGEVFKVDIASGSVLKQWSAAGAPGFVDIGGLSVRGEIVTGRETTCNDGIDNDHDGLIDCADPDCGTDPACTGHGEPVVTCLSPVVPNDRLQCSANVACSAIASCSAPDGISLPPTCSPGPTYDVGTSTVTVTCAEGSHVATKLCTVQVADREAPHGHITAPASGSCSNKAVTVTDDFTDNCPGPLTRAYSPPPGPTYTQQGDYSVSLAVTDAVGNTATSSVSFSIDVTPPRVTLVNKYQLAFPTPVAPMSFFFTDTDNDGVSGGVVRERVLLAGCVLYDGATYGNGDGLLRDENLNTTASELCRLASMCGFTTLTNPMLVVEAQDCAGNVGADFKTFVGTYRLRPGLCGP